MKFRIPLTRRHSALSLSAAALTLIAGCGGGGAEGGGSPNPSPNVPTSKGRLSVSVAWPATGNPSRLIPTNALSIRIELLKGGSALRSILLARPNTTADFTELPLGAMDVRATAYPNADGTGTSLATTTVGATIVADTPTSIPVTMASTVASVAFGSPSLTLVPNGTQNVSVTAKNASGDAVLIPAASLSYASNAAGLVKVTKNADGTAKLEHVAGVGTATITVTESGSGKTATLPVTVGTTISVSPTTATVSISGTATFTATVLGPTNTSVTWSVTESGGGTVSSAGVYSAPATKGTYHVVATSVADPTKKATVTVQVKSGTGSVIVN